MPSKRKLPPKPSSAKSRKASVYCNADKIAGRFRRRSKSLPEITQDFLKLDGQNLLAKARGYSSLTDHSLKDLAKMGHPYRRRFKGGAKARPHPAWLIHTQGGQFLKRWQLAVSITQDGGTATVFNRTPYASFLQGGTKNMIARPILNRVLMDTRNQRKAGYNAIRRSIMDARGAARSEVAAARKAGRAVLAQAAVSPMSIISQSLRSGARALRMGAGL